MNWTHGEQGPTCFCGMPTYVMISEDNKRINLLCVFHTSEAGALFPLPINDRPDNWLNLTDEEMSDLIDRGIKEQELEE